MSGIVQTSDVNSENIWQDREIRFDVHVRELDCRRGEFLIDHMDAVEDTKARSCYFGSSCHSDQSVTLMLAEGNNGEKGQLMISNLRMVWQCDKNRRTNLSIGYNCVKSINIRTASSKLRGQTQALYVLTVGHGANYEFIFTNLVKNSPRLFTTVQAVLRAYDTTKLYRDLRLRGAIVEDNEIKLLPSEQTYSKVPGVWNLSSENGSLGTFFITNVRLVWFANSAETFNVSMPYLQMKSVRMRDSKFGLALVLETAPQRSGRNATGKDTRSGYILGFRIDPVERMREVFKEIHSLWQLFSVNPVFGVDWKMEERPEALAKVTVARQDDDVEIVDAAGRDNVAAYYAEGEEAAEGGADTGSEIIFYPDLGLAVEKPKEGTLEALWDLL